MKQAYSGYYEFLQHEIGRFRGDFDPYINYLPDIFRLLTDLLNRKELQKEDRRLVCCALGYFVAPDDVIPEEIYGPAGYADDMFVCCYVVNQLITSYGIEFVQGPWQNEDELSEVLEYAFKKSSDEMVALGVRDEVLGYVGLG